MVQRFVSLQVSAPSRELAERVSAEAFEAGASGLEERADGRELVVYAAEARAEPVWQALRPFEGVGVVVGRPEVVAPVDWSQAWQEGLVPIEISPRLLIRPSFTPRAPQPGQEVLVIDAGQAFGTGAHASTRLALVLLDALPASLREGARVLDVGCGSGVLALAALRLGAARAVALDLDPLATEATRANARNNGLADGVQVLTGSLDALAPGRFDLVLANLLRSELEPLLPALAGALAPRGSAIVSGLLASEHALAARALGAVGLAIEQERRLPDGGDEWLGLHVIHG